MSESAEFADRDPVVEVYKAGVDRTLIRERLKRTPAERADDLVALARFADELARAGDERRRSRPIRPTCAARRRGRRSSSMRLRSPGD